MFYDLKSLDTSYNYEKYKKDRAEGGNTEKMDPLGYDLKDVGFIKLLETIVLGSTATFEFAVDDGDVKKWIARYLKKKTATEEEIKEHK